MMALVTLFLLFFRIGLFSFGGGYAMLPLIYQGVRDLGLMGPEEFARLVALSQVTPGPIAVNAATYVGYQYAGAPGAIVATIGVVLPSLILVLIVTHFVLRFRESQTLAGIMEGIRPVTVGLLFSAAVYLGQASTAMGTNIHPVVVLFFLIAAVAYGKFKVHPITLTILAGIAGALLIR
jgi:chromate transporter